MSKAVIEMDTVVHDAKDRRYHALGLAQLPVWLDLLVAGEANYRIGGWARVDGRLDHADLRQSIRLVMARHDGLRVRVDADRPRQWLDESSEPPFHVTTYGDGTDPEDALKLQIERFLQEPMPLGDNPLFHIDLVEVGPYSYLIWRLHHIIADHFSVRIALSHLFNAYQVVTSAGEAKLSPGSSILDTLGADADYLKSAAYKRDLAYWIDRFDPLPPPLLAMQPSPAASNVASPSIRRTLDRDRYAAFTVAAKEAGTLPSRALFGLLAVALGRRYGQTDITCGMLLHRRDRTNFHVVGMLTGFIPVRFQFEPWWTLIECVQAVSEQVDADLRHQRLPNDILHRELGSPEHGLFDAMMSWMPADDARASDNVLPGMVMAPVDSRDPSPITLNAQENARSGGLDIKIAVNPAFSEQIDARYLVDLLNEVITAFIEAGECEFESISPIPASEAQRLTALSESPLSFANAAKAATMSELVAGFAQSQPDAPAIVEALPDDLQSAPQKWRSYGELDADASRLARVLIAAGVRPHSVVGVCLERDSDLLTTLFAIWKAGATYLPLDRNYPTTRLTYMLEDAGAMHVVASDETFATIAIPGISVLRLDSAEVQNELDAASAERFNSVATAQSLAYLIYTSGSTGKPKGVMVAHAQLMAFRNAITAVVGVNADDCVFSAAAPIFDAFFMDLAVSLGVGARMVRLQARALASPDYLASAADAYGVTYMDLTPSVWRAALMSGWQPGADMQVVSGGEAIDAELASLLTANGARLYNSYGPTEATVVAIAGKVSVPETGSSVAIGKPLAGTQAYVLANDQTLLPIGVPGELVLGGVQITNGYLNRPDLTSAAFIANPFSESPEARLYRTGDLVRWRSDGQLEFLGRIDTQVKIRGMRVELGEIETALSAIEGIRQAVVTAPLGADGQAQLRAYIVPQNVPGHDAEAPITSDATQVLEAG